MVVHGDDFTSLGVDESLDWLLGRLRSVYELKHRGRIGPGVNDDKELRLLKRIVCWGVDGIRLEADQRHVEIAIKELGMEACVTLGMVDGKNAKRLADAYRERSLARGAGSLADERVVDVDFRRSGADDVASVASRVVDEIFLFFGGIFRIQPSPSRAPERRRARA